MTHLPQITKNENYMILRKISKNFSETYLNLRTKLNEVLIPKTSRVTLIPQISKIKKKITCFPKNEDKLNLKVKSEDNLRKCDVMKKSSKKLLSNTQEKVKDVYKPSDELEGISSKLL